MGSRAFQQPARLSEAGETVRWAMIARPERVWWTAEAVAELVGIHAAIVHCMLTVQAENGLMRYSRERWRVIR